MTSSEIIFLSLLPLSFVIQTVSCSTGGPDRGQPAVPIQPGDPAPAVPCQGRMSAGCATTISPSFITPYLSTECGHDHQRNQV